MRILFLHLLLILVPFVIYWTYISFIVRKKSETGGKWDDAPFTLLFAAGLVLAITSLISFGLNDGVDPTAVYEPSRIEDGEFKPGEFREDEPSSEDK